MTCPECGHTGGYHTLTCGMFAMTTLGMGTVRDLPLFGGALRGDEQLPEEMQDCAAEGMAAIEQQGTIDRGDL